MDNYNSNGFNLSDDTFGYIPPNLMYTDDLKSQFSSKEELERYLYHLEHDNDLHLKENNNFK